MTIETAAALARINERGQRLEEQGYRIERHEAMGDVFYVHKPGEPIWSWYLVTIGLHPFCQCGAFGRWGDCKHRVAAAKKAAEDAQADSIAADFREYEEFGRWINLAGKL